MFCAYLDLPNSIGGSGENTGKPIRNLLRCHRSDCNIRLRKVRCCDDVKFDSECLLLNVFRQRIIVILKICYWLFLGDLQFIVNVFYNTGVFPS